MTSIGRVDLGVVAMIGFVFLLWLNDHHYAAGMSDQKDADMQQCLVWRP